YVVDILDRDIRATPDDDVLAPTRNTDVSVAIAPRAVPGHQPTVSGKALLGESGALNIADEGVCAAGDQIAFLLGAHFRARRITHSYLHFLAGPTFAGHYLLRGCIGLDVA